jgi:hypothetical protein
MKINVLLMTAVAAVITTAAQAHGSPEFFRSQWSDAVPVTEVNSPAPDGCPIESADGLSLLIASARPGTLGGNDIWAADRASLTSPWSEPRNLGAPINTTANDFCPTPVYGRSLFFVSERAGDGTGPTLAAAATFTCRARARPAAGAPR